MAYLTQKGQIFQKTQSFPRCSVQELLGNCHLVRNAQITCKNRSVTGSVGLLYEAGELCLLMEQKQEEEDVSVILRLTLSDDGRISQIDLCEPAFFRYRTWNGGEFVTVSPVRGDVEERDGRIRISDRYYGELSLAFLSIGLDFDEYGEENLSIAQWEEVVQTWRALYDFESFDALLEEVGGVDYEAFSVKHPKAFDVLKWSGGRIWENRCQAPYIVQDLMEWTQAYKSCRDSFNVYGF